VVAGVITEFIAATFMLVYKATMQQANTYVAILARINTVGMAIQIVESISKDYAGLTEIRASMAKSLLESLRSGPAPTTTD
jgi:hypothetical protein